MKYDAIVQWQRVAEWSHFICDHVKEHLTDSWNEPKVYASVARDTSHGIGLPRPSLAIGEETRVKPVPCGLRKGKGTKCETVLCWTTTHAKV